MAKLTAKARSKIPSSKFAGPGRSYPIEDRAHAIAALRLVGRGVKAGHLTLEQAQRIRAKARRKLGQTSKQDKMERV